MADDKDQSDISPEELTAAFQGPALLTNKFYVTIGPHGVRIAFTEQQSPPTAPPAFRTAVVMSIQDGIQLRNVLIGLLSPIEAEIAKADRAATANANPGSGARG